MTVQSWIIVGSYDEGEERAGRGSFSVRNDAGWGLRHMSICLNCLDCLDCFQVEQQGFQSQEIYTEYSRHSLRREFHP